MPVAHDANAAYSGSRGDAKAKALFRRSALINYVSRKLL